MDRILDEVESLFENAGYHVSKRCRSRPSCFDFVARREKRFAFVKTYSNIGSIYEEDGHQLATLARFLYGVPLFVCDKSRKKPLEDDTIYSRYSVGAITRKTLEDALLRGTGPLIEATPGGYYVSLDGETIKAKRLERAMSIGKVAEIMGISRRTLYGYERGMTRASVSTAYKLEWFWGLPLVKPIDIFQQLRETESILTAARRVICRNRLLQSIVRKLLQLGFSVVPFRRAPFDFAARTPRDQACVLGAVACEKERSLKARAEEIVSISKIVEAQPVFVGEDNVSVDSAPFIHREEFERIECSEDFTTRL